MTGVVKIRLSLVIKFALTKPAVKRVRMEKGFSQQRMGEMVGIHRTIVSNIEGRRFVPNVKQRQAIADLLGGRESDFFDQQTGLAK